MKIQKSNNIIWPPAGGEQAVVVAGFQGKQGYKVSGRKTRTA
jgi:hypothetical protein